MEMARPAELWTTKAQPVAAVGRLEEKIRRGRRKRKEKKKNLIVGSRMSLSYLLFSVPKPNRKWVGESLLNKTENGRVQSQKPNMITKCYLS